jgi:hypothetical protein
MAKGYFLVREEFLRPPLSERELGLREVRRAGRALSGNPRDLRMFGMGVLTWYSLGIRILGRTAVEMTRDRQAAFFAGAVAGTLRREGHEIGQVVDPFLGSGNLLYHFTRCLGVRHCVGFELDHSIYDLARANFSRLQRVGKLRGVTFELKEADWSEAGRTVNTTSSVAVLHPPWGGGFGEHGLDLRLTTPPVMSILRELSDSATGDEVFAAVHTHPWVVRESVMEVRDSFDVLETVLPDDPAVAARIDYLLVRLR